MAMATSHTKGLAYVTKIGEWYLGETEVILFDPAELTQGQLDELAEEMTDKERWELIQRFTGKEVG